MTIAWIYDLTDNIFDKSGIVEITPDFFTEHPNEDDYELEENCYELTSEGEELYEQWCEDYGVGYDLCYGRMKGLADQYTKTELWEHLISDPTLSKIANL